MKRQIRHNVFETNSSSTHSLTMCMAEDFDKWENEELLFYDGYEKDVISGKRFKSGNFYTKEDVIEFLKHKGFDNSELDNMDKEEIFDILHEWEFYDYDYYMYDYNDNLESYNDRYTTPNGEEVVAFGFYGYDG